MRAALRGLFYDFHALMNNEIIFLHVPRYIKEKDFELRLEKAIAGDETKKYGLTYDDGLRVWHLFDILGIYAQLYFIYLNIMTIITTYQ